MDVEEGISLSVVLPTLNEEGNICQALESIQNGCNGKPPEVIVVDGGSTDKTIEFVKKKGVQVLQCEKGRGNQLNKGWKNAKGEWILFLHSDCVLPKNYDKLINSAVSKNPRSVWGCFEGIKVDFTSWTISIVEFGSKLRTRYGRIPYGDQGIFVKKQTLQQINGVKEWPLMEDVELAQQLNKISPPAIVNTPLKTSGRRWKKIGVLQTTLINWSIVFMYYAGVDVYTLANYYYGIGKKFNSK